MNLEVTTVPEPVSVSDRFLRPAPPERGASQRGTVLLVEDDAGVRLTMEYLFRSWGLRVLTADSEEQALWVWERHGREVDLLFTDLMIPPSASGAVLVRRFRAERPGLEVILTSGFGPEIGEEDPDFPRDVPFFQKPCEPGVLRAAVEAALERARAA